jgi:hypothetical protein
METLLIDIGALAVFLGYVAIVYWHGISHDTQRDRRRVTDESPDASWRGSGRYRIGF